MNITEYLNLFTTHSELTFVGPLNEKPISTNYPVIFVDGGVRFRQGSQQGFAVGDGDSSPLPLDQTLPSNKNYSDLAYALRHVNVNFKSLHLIGFLGGRKDHELMNFAEVHRFLLDRSSCCVDFDQRVLVKSRGQWTLNIYGTFSLFTFAPTKVLLQGDCTYDLKHEPLTHLSSHGLSNLGNGRILLENDNPVFIFL